MARVTPLLLRGGNPSVLIYFCDMNPFNHAARQENCLKCILVGEGADPPVRVAQIRY